MPNFKCAYCGKEFYNKHSNAKYCSIECACNVTRKNLTHPGPRYTDEFLLENLVQLADKLGRTPTYKDITIPSTKTYQHHFGSFNNAVVKAGLTPNVALPKEYFENGESDMSVSLRFKILQRDGFRCQYCGGTPQDGYVLHVDHIIPLSKGGKTTEDNLITSCWLCNIGKSNKTQ